MSHLSSENPSKTYSLVPSPTFSIEPQSPRAGAMEPPAASISSPARLAIPLNALSNSPPKRIRPPQQTLFSPFESDDDPAQQTSMSISAPDESPSEPESAEKSSAHLFKSISRLRCQHDRYRQAYTNHSPRKRLRTHTFDIQPHPKYHPSKMLRGLSQASHDIPRTRPNKDLREEQQTVKEIPRVNGVTVTEHSPADKLNPSCRKKIPSASLWEQLAEARHGIDSRPRHDPRFVPNSRPLDCLKHLRTSIVVTLFPDGYVRHDWSARPSDSSRGSEVQNPTSAQHPSKPGALSSKQQTAISPKTPNIDQLPRFPYERSSADFLRCLDLGLIPHLEDLPEPHQRFYYDGCLIAEIRDKRTARSVDTTALKEGHYKVLLRPHMASIYQDITLLTANVDQDIALMVESEVLRLTSCSLHLEPYPRLTSCLSGTGVHTNIHPLNIIRLPKRKRLLRPPGAPYVPSLSTAVMLLVSAADKQQTIQRNNNTLSESSSTATQAVNAGVSSVPSPNVAVRNTAESLPVKGSGPPTEVRSNSVQEKDPKTPQQRRRYRLPSKELLTAAYNLKPSGRNVAAVTKRNPNRQQQRGPPSHERLRIMRLILPDRQLAVQLQQAQARAQAAAKIGTAAAERAKLDRNQMLARINKPVPVNFVEMVRQPNQVVEILFVKGIAGEKSRDVSHVIVPSEEEGKLVMDQFKSVATKEGYICFQDLSAADLLAYQQQQQARAAYPQRHGSGILANAQSRTTSRTQLHQNGQPHQQQARTVQRGTRQGIAANAAGIQHLEQAQAKQKQMQAQRHQQHLRTHQQQQQHSQQHPQQQPHLQQQLPQQSHQLYRQQQLQRQQQHQQQQMQNQQRVREHMQQLQRLDKTAQTGAPTLIHPAGGGQAVSNSVPTLGASLQIQRGPSGSASLNSTGLSNLANGGSLTQGQMFPPGHLQQLQQMRSRQMRADQHRNMFAALPGNPGSFNQANNLNGSGLTPQQYQNQALVAAMGSAAMNARATAGVKGLANASIAGVDGLNHPGLPPQMKHQGENMDTPSRVAKR